MDAEEMKIGTIQRFGMCNNNGVQFGFLRGLDGGEDIYFNENSADRSSVLYTPGNGAGQYEARCVVYKKRRYGSRVSAAGVMLLSELPPLKLNRLYQLCRDQGRSAELAELARTAPQLFQREPLSFFQAYLDQPHILAILRRRYEEMAPEELEQALGADPAEYLLHLGRGLQNVEQLFARRCQQGGFTSSPARAGVLLAQRRETDKPLLTLINALDVERESVEDLAFLTAQIRAAGRSAAPLLQRRPDLLWTDPELCAATNRLELHGLPLEQLIQTEEQLAFLAAHAQPGLWTAVVESALPAGLLLRCERALEELSDSRTSNLLAQADWRDTSPENLELWRPLLGRLSAVSRPMAVTAAVRSLHAQGMALELCWWQLLSESVRVRLLIYLSNFKQELTACPTRLAQLNTWEAGQGSPLLLAMLRFLVTIFTDDPERKRGEFLKAHQLLMEYITDRFTQGLDVTPGLASLLEHCRSSVPRWYFCEARIWRRRKDTGETVDTFCPSQRSVCLDHKHGELKKTPFRKKAEAGETPDYSEQFLMDYLLNLGELPDLTQIGVSEREEYPFRISAFVNSLIQLRPHMRCQVCSELFHPKFQYAKLKNARLSINRYACSRAGDPARTHDADVYLNFCYHCGKIIDSRECLHREPGGGQYLCMHCGGAQNTTPGSICPSCGSTDQSKLHMKGRDRIICQACGYDSIHFVSTMETGLLQP